MATMTALRARFSAIQEQLGLDKVKHLPGLDKALDAAIEAGDASEAERLSELREQLLNTIEAEELEIRLLGNEVGARFRQGDVVGVRIISIGKGNRAQAEVKIVARGGKTVTRHVHLVDGRDCYGNYYRVA